MQKNMVIAMLIILIILIGAAYIISERENEKLTLQNRRLLKRLERKEMFNQSMTSQLEYYIRKEQERAREENKN